MIRRQSALPILALVLALTQLSLPAPSPHQRGPAQIFDTGGPLPTGLGEEIGIRPDCSETPFAYAELLAQIRRPEVRDTASFMAGLPSGVLQSFTLMRQSDSGQREFVTPEMPRVIRFDTLGALFLGISCNPANHGMEVIRWDARTSAFKFSKVHFDRPPAERVEEDPVDCQRCHNTAPEGQPARMTPLWSDYSEWPGSWGEADDRVGNPGFVASRSRWLEDGCMSELPWPRRDILQDRSNEYYYYPYSSVYKTLNLDLRPNLRLTNLIGRRTAEKIAAHLWRSPAFRPIRYLILARRFDCAVTDAELAELRALPTVPAFTYPDGNYFMPSVRAPTLYAASMAAGLTVRDWTPEPNFPDTPYYHSAILDGTGDASIAEVVWAELLMKATAELPRLSEGFVLGRDTDPYSLPGPRYGCVDRLPGSLRGLRDIPLVCRELLQAHRALR